MQKKIQLNFDKLSVLIIIFIAPFLKSFIRNKLPQRLFSFICALFLFLNQVIIPFQSSEKTAIASGNPPRVYSVDLIPLFVVKNQPRFVALAAIDDEFDPLTYTVISNPSHGTLSGTGEIRYYIPNQDYVGPDSFSYKVNDGTSDSNVAVVNLKVEPTWVPPIGVPMPEFGITDQAPVYNQNNPLHYYVDRTNLGSCSDSSNGERGSPSVPRCSIPYDIPAGALVEVHGIYDYYSGTTTIHGTQSQPVFIRGRSRDEKPRVSSKMELIGSYFILENFEFFRDSNSEGKVTVYGPSDHAAIRHNLVIGNNQGGDGGIFSQGNRGTNALVEQVTFYDNALRDNGYFESSVDDDQGRMFSEGYTRQLWMVDNICLRNGGLCGAGSTLYVDCSDENDPCYASVGNEVFQYVYVGRQLAAWNRETNFWVKEGNHIIFSQNTSIEPYDLRPGNSPSGMGFQYGPNNVWFLYNHIHHAKTAISFGSNSIHVMEPDNSSYMIGNVINDIHFPFPYEDEPFGGSLRGPNWSSAPGAALVLLGGVTKYFIGNTVYDTDGGIHTEGGNDLIIRNNIFDNVNRMYHPEYSNYINVCPTRNFVLENNLFFTELVPNHSDGSLNHANAHFRVCAHNTYVDSLGQEHFFSANVLPSPIITNNNLEIDPMFENAPNNFRLQANSMAIDQAIDDPVLDVFQSLYTIDIHEDFERISRPQGNGLDMGAYEYPVTQSCNFATDCQVRTCKVAACISNVCEYSNTSDGSACDDRNACTLVDQCQTGSCRGTSPRDCNDSIACTSDSCVPQSGSCVNTPNDNLCAQNEQCIIGEGCIADTFPPQIISGPDVSNITESSATISWVTDEVSTTVVNYGVHSTSEATIQNSNLTMVHAANLSNLGSGTTYQFEIYSEDAGQNFVTQTGSFTTDNPADCQNQDGTYVAQPGENSITIEAEHYCDKLRAPDTAGHEWLPRTDLSGYVGDAAISALPDDNQQSASFGTGTGMTFRFRPNISGNYFVSYRANIPNGNSDSVFTGVNGAEKRQVDWSGSTNGWRWLDPNASNQYQRPVDLGNLDAGRDYVLSVVKREDGVSIDRLFIGLSTTTFPAGSEAGPAESENPGIHQNQAPNGTIDTPSGSVTISAGESVNFSGTGADPDNNLPLTYLWNFGGGAANSASEDPGAVTFNTPGTYHITFTVTDSLGLPDPTPASISITVNSASQMFTITASAGPNGSISPAGNIPVQQSTSQVFNITPNSGYQIQDVLVDSASVGTVSNYTFTNVQANHTISATFELIPTGSNIIYVDRTIGSSSCTNYHVASRSCGSGSERAYRTIPDAAAVAVAGDTVFIRGGTYNESLNPANSGTSGHYISFKAYNSTSEPVTLSTGNTLAIVISDRNYILIEGLIIQDSMWLEARNSHFNVISNNSFLISRATGTTGNVRFVSSHFNKILNNRIEDGNDNLLLIDSERNLVEGNSISIGNHSLWGIRCGDYNVIRGNHFENADQKSGEIYDCGQDTSAVPNQFDGTKKNLVERNVFALTRATDQPHRYNAIQYSGQNGIIRNNVFYNNFGGGLHFQVYGDEALYNYGNRAYHNSYYNNSCFAVGASSANDPARYFGNRVENNVLFQNFNCSGNPPQINIGNPVAVTLSSNSIVDTNPGFVDAPNHNFHLSLGSPLINAGTFLTRTTASGSGASMQVQDAQYFYDTRDDASGISITDANGNLVADEIQLEGQTQTAKVINVDYAANLLTLDRPLTWNSNQGVSLKYSGLAPDMGAFEFEETGIPSCADGIQNQDETGTDCGGVCVTGTESLCSDGQDNDHDCSVDQIDPDCAAQNEPPVANASSDQSVTDSDGNNTELVTLDGSQSFDSDGTIVNYKWQEEGVILSEGASSTAQAVLSVGAHTIILTVTDNDGLTDTDEVNIVVNPFQGECLSDSECARLNDACNNGICDLTNHVCVAEPKTNGTACDDSAFCTTNDTCENGECLGGALRDCSSESNQCNDGICNETTDQCEAMPKTDGTSCEDDNVCNGSEACLSGNCIAGTPLPIDDQNPCTSDSCDPIHGVEHTNVLDGTSCSDQNLCNGAEVCLSGACTSNTPPSIDDNNPCTSDSCDPIRGVTHTSVADGTSCSDFDVCNGEETCQAGVCEGGAGLNCNDGSWCNGEEACDHTLGCRQGVAPCGEGGACNETNRQCVVGCAAFPDPDGSCNDDNVCNGVETCNLTTGICESSGSQNCDDHNPCTADSCDPIQGCIHTPVADHTSCGDGDLCNGTETCLAGVCQNSGALDCDDHNPCTTESCEPSAGCVYASVLNGTSCGDSDSNVCNGVNSCQEGICTPGNSLNCDDHNPCTADSCDQIQGCLHQAVLDGTQCNDSNLCNGANDICSSGICKSQGPDIDCDDGNKLTIDSCSPNTGECRHISSQDINPERNSGGSTPVTRPGLGSNVVVVGTSDAANQSPVTSNAEPANLVSIGTENSGSFDKTPKTKMFFKNAEDHKNASEASGQGDAFIWMDFGNKKTTALPPPVQTIGLKAAELITTTSKPVLPLAKGKNLEMLKPMTVQEKKSWLSDFISQLKQLIDQFSQHRK